MIELRPITQKAAFAFVEKHHRHHNIPPGALWQHACHDEEGQLVGVAIVGRPLARKLDDGLSTEVTRLCTLGTPNACSLLYAACRRVAIDKGYRRGLSYILETEDGASLRASGWASRHDAGAKLERAYSAAHRHTPARPQASLRLGLVATIRD